jgi:hypothetical protein
MAIRAHEANSQFPKRRPTCSNAAAFAALLAHLACCCSNEYYHASQHSTISTYPLLPLNFSSTPGLQLLANRFIRWPQLLAVASEGGRPRWPQQRQQQSRLVGIEVLPAGEPQQQLQQQQQQQQQPCCRCSTRSSSSCCARGALAALAAAKPAAAKKAAAERAGEAGGSAAAGEREGAAMHAKVDAA